MAFCKTFEKFRLCSRAKLSIHAGIDTLLRMSLVSTFLLYANVSERMSATVEPFGTSSDAIGVGGLVSMCFSSIVRSIRLSTSSAFSSAYSIVAPSARAPSTSGMDTMMPSSSCVKMAGYTYFITASSSVFTYGKTVKWTALPAVLLHHIQSERRNRGPPS